MKPDIESFASNLTQTELLLILRNLGHEVVFAPAHGMTGTGERFIWHKPFIDEKACLEAVDIFKNQQGYKTK
jgi:hypothetical protein